MRQSPLRNPRVPKLGAWLKAQREREKNEKLLKAALRGFHPKKEHRGQWVFISAHATKTRRAGTPLKYSDRHKAFAVYVPKKVGAKIMVYKEPRRRQVAGRMEQLKSRVEVPVPRRPHSVDLARGETGQRRMSALDYYYTRVPIQLRPEIAEGRARVEQGQFKTAAGTEAKGSNALHMTKATGLDFETDIVDKTSRALQRVASTMRQNRTIMVAGLASVTGQKEPIQFHVKFDQSDQQVLTDKDFYKPFVRLAVYSQFADSLSRMGLVSAKSSRYIKKLPANRGKPRSKWVDSRGHPWRKATFKEVQIKQMDLRFFKLVPTAGKPMEQQGMTTDATLPWEKL